MKYTECSSLCTDESCSITESKICDYLENQVYAVRVVFHDRGYWSKAYIYISDIEISKDSVVIVPTYGFYSIGKVLDSIKNYPFKAHLKYKKVIQTLELKDNTNV